MTLNLDPDADLATPEGRLREARRHAGFSSPEEAAKRCLLNAADLSAHEAGRKRYYGKRAASYGTAFNVDPNWLFDGRGTKAPRWADPTRIAFEKWRRSAGLSYAQVAKRAGVQTRMISDWATGISASLFPIHYRKITQAFGSEMVGVFDQLANPVGDEADELIEIWKSLDASGRARALAVLKALKAHP